MKGWHKLLKSIYEIKEENKLTYEETAEVLERAARHYRYWSKVKFGEEVDKILKEQEGPIELIK